MKFQVDLLLGKAYSDWGHVSDAVSVYDQLISSQPNDFRGYLAKVGFMCACYLNLFPLLFHEICFVNVEWFQILLPPEYSKYANSMHIFT